jgi:hypothetical protein
MNKADTNTPAVRLDRHLDGSADVYIQIPADGDPAALEDLSYSIAEDVKPGQEFLIGHLDAGEVREFRERFADDRIPDPQQDN